MIITPIAHGFELARNTEGYVRSPGRHMSDLYGAYYKALEPNRFDKRDKQGNPLPFDPVRLEMGLVFEEMMETGLKLRLAGAERPGEFFTNDRHNIAYSPDLLFTEPEWLRLGEIKLTWMSARDCPISPEQGRLVGIPANWDGVGDAAFPAKFDKYFTQMKLYGHHLQTPHQRLIVFFVNGNYAPPSPFPLAWDLYFTPAEMAEEWRIIERFGIEQGLLAA